MCYFNQSHVIFKEGFQNTLYLVLDSATSFLSSDNSQCGIIGLNQLDLTIIQTQGNHSRKKKLGKNVYCCPTINSATVFGAHCTFSAFCGLRVRFAGVSTECSVGHNVFWPAQHFTLRDQGLNT